MVGRKDVVGKPLLFGTTDEFLKRFELQSLDDLPNYDELMAQIKILNENTNDSIYNEFDIDPDAEDEEEYALNEKLQANA